MNICGMFHATKTEFKQDTSPVKELKMKKIILAVMITVIAGVLSAAEITPVPFETLDKGTFSGFSEEAYMIIENQESWETMWHRHKIHELSGNEPPPIDFESSTVVAVFMGECPGNGFEIEVTGIHRLFNHGLIQLERNDEPGMLTVITQPYCITVMEKQDVSFYFSDEKLPFLSFDKGFSENPMADANVVVQDMVAWETIWTLVHGRELPAPYIDFNNYIVLGVSYGLAPNNGYAIEVVNISVTGDDTGQDVLLTTVKNTVPRRGIFAPEICYPYEFVIMERSHQPLLFIEYSN